MSVENEIGKSRYISPVDVLLNLLGHLEVDDVPDVVDVESAGSDRRGDQDGMFPWTREMKN